MGSFFRRDSKVDVDSSDVELPPWHVFGLHNCVLLAKKPVEADDAAYGIITERNNRRSILWALLLRGDGVVQAVVCCEERKGGK